MIQIGRVAERSGVPAKTIRYYEETGRAIAIGHPYDETLEVLRRWLPDARKRGFEFVPISTIAALECAC